MTEEIPQIPLEEKKFFDIYNDPTYPFEGEFIGANIYKSTPNGDVYLYVVDENKNILRIYYRKDFPGDGPYLPILYDTPEIVITPTPDVVYN